MNRTITILLACVLLISAGFSSLAQGLKGRAVWAHPWGVGNSRESVTEFVEKIDAAHINTVVMMFKGVGGDIYWQSERFAGSVRRGYQDFDMPAILIEECHKRGIEVHAWFCDFPDGPDGEATKAYPEWQMLDPEGQPTDEEILRGRKYGMRWMCPARRPGYTDQWLIPLISEFAQKYDVDAIHHDYVRYPGDLAPDTYCFCDYCLENIPKFAGLYSQKYPEEPFFPSYDRPHLEAHWEPGPRALPLNWDEMPRDAKSRFLLNGSFFPGGNNDLDYFFYRYRTHWITQFTREVFEEVRFHKPEMEFSAAVFKNPVHSGRFIGQDWREFSDWVQYMMPMDYRAHYPGDFETHLDLLEESIHQQKEWARDVKHLWVGVSSGQLYEEENRLYRTIRNTVEEDEDPLAIQSALEKTSEALKKHSPETLAALDSYFASSISRDELKKALESFIKANPSGFRPPEKFLETLNRVKGTGVEGIVVFSIEDVMRAGLLDDLGEFFESGA